MELRTWIERLEPLKVGETTPLLPLDSVQSVYSAIKDHPERLKGRKYRVSRKKGVVGRIK